MTSKMTPYQSKLVTVTGHPNEHKRCQLDKHKQLCPTFLSRSLWRHAK